MGRGGESRDRGEKYLWEYWTNLSTPKINWLQVFELFGGSFLFHWSVCFVPVPHGFGYCINWLHQFAFPLAVEHSSRSTSALKFGIYFSYSSRTTVVSHCGFHLHLSNDLCWASFHLFIWHQYIFISEIPIQFSCFFSPIDLFPVEFWIIFYILDTIFFFLPDIPSCKDFPTGLWIAFSFFNSLLQNKSFAILLKSNLSLFNLYHVLGVIIMISLPNPVRKIFCFFPQSL